MKESTVAIDFKDLNTIKSKITIKESKAHYVDFDKMKNDDIIPFLRMMNSHWRVAENLFKEHNLEHLIKEEK